MKRSLFSRFSGPADDFDAFDDDDLTIAAPGPREAERSVQVSSRRLSNDAPASSEGQLPVDVYQTPSDIVLRAFVAGVPAGEVSISISRDMVEISGARMEHDQVSDHDFFTRELFWGSFTRTIMLPQEIDVDSASATSRDGLLTIVLPKLDKARQTKLRVKAG